MKIAMFGGSFNPVHNGHVQLADTFRSQLSLDKVLIIPTYIPPHKESGDMASPEQRLEMCRLAFADRPWAEVSDIEIVRRGSSYTYLTILALKEKYPGDDLFLITGADMFMTIHQWKKPDVIFSNAIVCGIPRNDANADTLQKQSDFLKTLGADTIITDSCVMTVSSTRVRDTIRLDGDISSFVPEQVEKYIRNHRLYLSEHNLKEGDNL